MPYELYRFDEIISFNHGSYSVVTEEPRYGMDNAEISRPSQERISFLSPRDLDNLFSTSSASSPLTSYYNTLYPQRR